MKIVSINGIFLTKRIDGMYRFSYEILKELDKIASRNTFELVIPQQCTNIPKLVNIQVVKYGKSKGIIWEQITFAFYLIKNKRESLSFNNTTPLIYPGYSCLLDMLYIDQKNTFNNFHGKIAILWSRINYRRIAKGKRDIITISNFSKSRISNLYNVEAEKIHVVYCAWQHMKSIIGDKEIFSKNTLLNPKEYYFTLASMSEYKNFKWIVEAAKHNPHSIFAIAGGSVKSSKYIHELDKMDNVLVLGYVTDSEVVSLMRYCKAFLFPSKYEGFGLPPLEAMSLGAKVLISNRGSLPEVYKDYAIYFDPDDYEINLDELFHHNVKESFELLSEYSWQISALKIMNIIIHD